MTSYTYSINYPKGNLSPASQRSILTTNTNSISSIIGVDHVGFNTAGGGYHQQITLNAFQSPSTPSGEVSILYGAAGTGDANAPQLFLTNSNDTFHISPIRAYAQCSWNGSTLSTNLSYNISSISRSSKGRCVVTWDATAVDSSNYLVFITPGLEYNTTALTLPNVETRNAGNVHIIFTDPTANAVADPRSFSIMILDL